MTIDLTRLTNLSARVQERAKPAPAATGKSWYRIQNIAADVAEVYLYDGIGEFGVTARDFVAELNSVRARRIELHLNSPGGAVFDGVAIYNALVNHPAEVTTFVDGLAASAASFIAMAGDRIVMEKNARFMIHDAAGLVIGNAKDMREMADLLDSLSDTIAEVYADRAGGEIATWRAAMRAETWYTAREALAAGLATAIAGQEQDPDPEPDTGEEQKPEQPTEPAPTAPDEEPEDSFDVDEFQRLMKEAFSS